MKWDKKDVSPETVKETSARFGCDFLTASILARRGIASGQDICFFLEDDPRYLHNPFLLPGMEDAVDRILAAKEEGEKVLVFGDRDVDGVTSTALLTGFLRGFGVDVSWRVPTGDEPYGLSLAAVEKFAADYGTLIITVDCGISCLEEIRRANELGVDVIVTDHHIPRDELPEALAIVNPKLADSKYPFRDLAGCGVAYKLVSALRFALKSDVYGQSVCLLNTRPVNDAWVVETVKLRNLAPAGSLTETVVPGMVSISNTRLPEFLQGQQILCWDGPLQKRTLAKLFGSGVEINMLDIAPEIGKAIPSAAGKSLLRLKEVSRLARYSGGETGELDVFVSLFTSFVRRRFGAADAEDERDLQLVSVGTIADIMPLRDENRILVRRGLAALREKPRPGLYELLFKLELAGRRLGAQEVSWQLSPAINSAGRMGSPEKAAALLLEENQAARETLASALMTMNSERRKLGGSTWNIVEPLAFGNMPEFNGKLACAWGENIPRGVSGLMAGRLTNRFNVPALVVSFGEDTATGSLRSARGYDLRFLLEPNAELFLDWGGHDYAAGFSMKRENWETFLARVKTASHSMELGEEEDGALISVDAELPLSYLTPDIFTIVDRFEPYGEGNAPLIFLARGLTVAEISIVGKEAQHVKLSLEAGKHKWPAVYWQAADKVKRDFDIGDKVDAVFEAARNFYKGSESPQLVLKDLVRAGG